MIHSLVIHPEAESELNSIYDYISERIGPESAWAYIRGVRDYLYRLSAFPERGSIRDANVNGLRLIGYRKRLSIAFVVRENNLIILGFLYAGSNIDPSVLRERNLGFDGP